MNYSTPGGAYSNFDAKDAFKGTKVVKMESIIKFPKYNPDKSFAVGFHDNHAPDLCGNVIHGSDSEFAEITFNANVEIDKTVGEYATGLVFLKSGTLIEIWAKIIAFV